MYHFVNNLGLWFMMVGLVGIIGYSSSKSRSTDALWSQIRVVADAKYTEAKAYVLELPEQAHAFWSDGPWHLPEGRMTLGGEGRWNLFPGEEQGASEPENR